MKTCMGGPGVRQGRCPGRLALRLALLVGVGGAGGRLLAQDPLEVLWSQPTGSESVVAFAPGGRWLATANAGVQLWRASDGAPAGLIHGAFGGITSLAVSADSLRVAVADADGVVRVFNVCDGGLAWTHKVAGDVTTVVYGGPDVLASCGSDRPTLDLWRADDGSLLSSIPGVQWSHHNVAFSQDARWLAIGGDADPKVELRSAADGGLVRTLVGHGGRVRTVAFSADGVLLATGGDDGTVRVWRVSDGASLQVLTGHTGQVWKVAVGANGTLASSGTEGTLRLWRLEDGKPLRAYATGDGGSLGLEFFPDGSAFALMTNGRVVVARNPVPAITGQPARLTRFAGEEAAFTVSATGEVPLRYQWFRQGAAVSGGTNAVLALTRLALADGGEYEVEVRNALGVVRSRAVDLVVLEVPTGPGSLDLRFDPTGAGARVGFAGGVPGVQALLLDPDGAVVLGGRFTAVNGVVRNQLVRVGQDGTVDPWFQPGLGCDGEVTALARQPDGALLVAGVFQAVDGRPCAQVARLRPTGALDPTFRVALAGSTWMPWTYPSCLGVQADGHIWVCGSFASVNGSACASLARLHQDGTLDTDFRWDGVAAEGGQSVSRVFVQPDGRVLVAGAWTNPACSLLRLLADGTCDPSFAGARVAVSEAGTPGRIDDLAVHRDGRMVVVGDFRWVNGVRRNGVAWLLPGGGLDPSFDPGSGAEDSTARRVVIEPDGRATIAGWFSRVQGSERRGFARLNPDGALDLSFDPGLAIGHAARPNVNALVRQRDGRYLVGADDWVARGTNCVLRLDSAGNRDVSLSTRLQLEPHEIRAAVVQPDGRVLVGGGFGAVNDLPRPGLARLESTGGLDPTFAPPAQLNLEVWSIAVQRDQRILVGGRTLDFSAGPAVLRLEPDGALDTGFAAPVVQGPCSLVETVVVQRDGRILIGGLFTSVAGRPRCALARLHGDGSLDEGFIPPNVVPSDDPGFGVEHIHVLGDGRILAAGGFSSDGGDLHSVMRLNADGGLDATFEPVLPERRPIKSLAVQPDGRILLAGEFPQGSSWGRLLRLMPDGGPDAAFEPEVGVGISAVALLSDGRILVATNSQVSGGVVRLNADGSLDPAWRTPLSAAGEYPRTTGLWLQPDGRVLITGGWLGVGNVPRPGIAMLNNDISACQLRVRKGLTLEGYFRVQFIGIPGARYAVDHSDNAVDWRPWILLEDPVSPLDLLDPTAGQVPHRFYRARLAP